MKLIQITPNRITRLEDKLRDALKREFSCTRELFVLKTSMLRKFNEQEKKDGEYAYTSHSYSYIISHFRDNYSSGLYFGKQH